jgi:mRNA interferase MazF
MVRRGQVWLGRLDPTVGSEIQKTRPCVIISPDEINLRLRTHIIAPMTTSTRLTPFRVPAPFLGKNGLVALEQIRAVDRERLIKNLGSLDASTLNAILGVLAELFAE